MDYFLYLSITGLATGFLYALLSLGFVVIYKSTAVLNFAQGALVMIGSYFCFAAIIQLGLHPVIGLLLASGMAVVLAFFIERLVLRPLIGKPLLSLVMVTIGLASIIEGIVISIWGTDQRVISGILPEIPVALGSVKIPSIYVWAFILSIFLIVIFILFFTYTNIGIVMKATANNQAGALSMGISVSRIFIMSWIFSSIIAVAGGFVLCNIAALSPGLVIIIYPLFAAVILGGLDSIPGALIGGLIIGVLQNLVAGYFGHITGGTFRVVFPFIILLVVLFIKPHGLFGTKEVERL